MQNKKTILLTGCLGTLGMPLWGALREKGYKVFGCDLVHNSDSEYFRCDVGNYRELAEIFKNQKFDYVYHLAAEFGRQNGEDYFEKVWETNVIGLKNIIQLQKEERFKLIFTSSSGIYGEAKTDLQEADIIICSEVLEHVPDPFKFLLSLKNYLKKEGMIILTTPNGYGWFELEKFVYEKFGLKILFKLVSRLIRVRKIIHTKQFLPLTTLNEKDKHLQRFTYKRLKLLFNQANLKIVRESRAGLFGGQISEILFGRFTPLLKLNNWLGAKLPIQLSIDWYFILKSLN